MNDEKPPTTEHDEYEPLDAFEQGWVDALNEPDPELVRTGEGFVARVMQEHTQENQATAVVGRIRPGLLPLALAAAVALMAYIGWQVYVSAGDSTPNQPFVENPAPVQPPEDTQVPPNETPKVALGELIAQAQSTATRPAASLTDALQDVPKALKLDKLIELVEKPVPDLNELLAPLKPNDSQSKV